MSTFISIIISTSSFQKGCGAEGVMNSRQTGRWLFNETTSYMTLKHRKNFLRQLRQRNKALRKEQTPTPSNINSGMGSGSGPRFRSGSASGTSLATIPVCLSDSGIGSSSDIKLFSPDNILNSNFSSGSATNTNDQSTNHGLEVKIKSIAESCSQTACVASTADDFSLDNQRGEEAKNMLASEALESISEKKEKTIEEEKEKKIEVEMEDRVIDRVINEEMQINITEDQRHNMIGAKKEVDRKIEDNSNGDDNCHIENESDEDRDMGSWREEEDDEYHFNTVVPSFLDLEADVALCRLQGRFCQINSGESDSDTNSNNNSSHSNSNNNINGNNSNGSNNNTNNSNGNNNHKSNNKSSKKEPTAESKKRRRGASKPKPTIQKPLLVQKNVIQKKNVTTPKNSTNFGSSSTGVDADAGIRAEAGDFRGLLVNGLFMSSVLMVDEYLMAKDAAIKKVGNCLDLE